MPIRRYPRALIYEQVCGELLFDPLREAAQPALTPPPPDPADQPRPVPYPREEKP